MCVSGWAYGASFWDFFSLLTDGSCYSSMSLNSSVCLRFRLGKQWENAKRKNLQMSRKGFLALEKLIGCHLTLWQLFKLSIRHWTFETCEVWYRVTKWYLLIQNSEYWINLLKYVDNRWNKGSHGTAHTGYGYPQCPGQCPFSRLMPLLINWHKCL